MVFPRGCVEMPMDEPGRFIGLLILVLGVLSGLIQNSIRPEDLKVN